MAPTPSSARRLAPAGCALIAVLSLLLLGCGEKGTAAPEGAARSPKPGSETKPESGPAGAGGCPKQVNAFVKSLDALRDQLAVGLSYDQYAAAIEDLRVAYDRVPIDRLALDCLATTGTPAERALNKYIDGANAWGECLADASCTTATIEPVLQRKWRVASRFLSEAD